MCNKNKIYNNNNLLLNDPKFTIIYNLVTLTLNFKSTGVCKWRDSKKPSEILEDFCSARLKGDSPIYTNSGNMVTIGRRSFSLSDFGEKQFWS